MNLSLRPARSDEMAASELLSRLNMASYRSSRGVSWDPERFRASWLEFENIAIVDGQKCCGFIRLLTEGETLEIRDLQIDPGLQGQGIGSWAISQVKAMAAARGYRAVRLRVFPENPAMNLYTRLGFSVDRDDGGLLHMNCPIPQSG
ncbi:MAG: GNAT family N-acetyltransferase [Pseudomarimonas sp.]